MFKAKFSTTNTMDAKFSSSEPMKAKFDESIRPQDGAVVVNPITEQTLNYQFHVNINSSTGKVTADFSTQDYVTADVTEGFVHSGTVRNTCDINATQELQLSTKAAQTITPTNAAQTIAAGKYLTGAQTIEGVTHNLSASDLRTGVNVKIGTATDDDSVASITGSYVYNPFGDNAELIATYPKETFLLKNTSFNGWTPSTTAKTIKASANYGTVSADMDQYEYFTKIMTDAKIVYADGTTLSGATVREITELFQYMYRKPNSLTNIASATDNYNYCTTMFTTPFMEYWNTGTPPVHTMTYSGSYGFYPSAASHTFSSSTSLTPTITIKRPSLSARCHNSYMTTAMAGAVDQNNSKIEVWGFLYRCKKGSFGWAAWRDMIAAYNA